MNSKPAEEAEDSEKPQPLKSAKSIQQSFVRFVNSTTRRADVIWINYNGQSVLYKTLDPNKFLDVDTFIGHPWIFRDSFTKQKLVIKSQDVFYPRESRRVRKVENITIPVYSLKEQCMYSITRAIKLKEDITRLELPRTVLDDLTKFCS